MVAPSEGRTDPAVTAVRIGGMSPAAVVVKVAGDRAHPGVVLAGVRRPPNDRRRWRVRTGSGFAGSVLQSIQLPAGLTPAELGLSDGIVVLEDGRPKHLYGADDDISGALRR